MPVIYGEIIAEKVTAFLKYFQFFESQIFSYKIGVTGNL